ncbi:MAG: hypothetical protein HEP71_07210 [Roseivirga sp.]|nr:hypothetical protein [Roseivirga sp.]
MKHSNICITFSLLSLMLLTACDHSEERNPKKLVVINIRGTSFAHVQTYAALRPESYLSGLLRNHRVTELTPIFNAVTATNLASFETGVYPNRHGIIGHQFGTRTDSLHVVSGFERRYEVPSFLEVADLQGLKVLNIGSLLLHGAFNSHLQLRTIAQGEALAAARQIALIASPAPLQIQEPSEYIQPLSISDSKARQIPIFGDYHIFVYAVDVQGETHFIVDNDSLPGNGYLARLKQEEWLELDLGLTKNLRTSTRIKFNGGPGNTSLFVRSPFINRGFPEAFLKDLEVRFGGSKGWPSLGAYFGGQINSTDVKSEINTEIEYLLNIYEHSLAQEDYDLIVMDYPLPDRYGHIFSIDFNELHTREAFDKMDADLEGLVKAAHENGYEILIQSGHGFSKSHNQINLTGLLSKAFEGSQQTDDLPFLAIPGKVSAQIYFKSGEKEALDRLKEKLLTWQDPKTGNKLFEGVWSKTELARLGLDHEDAGDLFLLLKPGYVFQANGSADHLLFSQPTFKGDHGYSPEYAESRGVLIHPGFTIATTKPHIVDVAPSVLKLLGIVADHAMDGKPLF